MLDCYFAQDRWKVGFAENAVEGNSDLQVGEDS